MEQFRSLTTSQKERDMSAEFEYPKIGQEIYVPDLDHASKIHTVTTKKTITEEGAASSTKILVSVSCSDKSYRWDELLPQQEKLKQKKLILQKKEKRLEQKIAELATKQLKKISAFIIPCKECDEIAVTVSFDSSSKNITVGYGNNSSSRTAEEDFLKAMALADLEEFADLDSILYRLNFKDGLTVFCPKCDGAYCRRHYTTFPVFEDGGWYDETRWTCDRGHSHGILD